VLSLDPVELNHSLARLTDAGLIHSRGLPPDAVYSFKHALIQDAAYTTMLRPRRLRLHGRMAQVLQAMPSWRSSPELLAHHYRGRWPEMPCLTGRRRAAGWPARRMSGPCISAKVCAWLPR
jgi:hypothetical protein